MLGVRPTLRVRIPVSEHDPNENGKPIPNWGYQLNAAIRAYLGDDAPEGDGK